MILEIGEKVYMIERRYFNEDQSRHFIGEIIKTSENAFRIKGYVWVFDTIKGFIRKPEERERVIYPSERLTINIIPKEINLDEIKYISNSPQDLRVTDGKKFTLDIFEFGKGK